MAGRKQTMVAYGAGVGWVAASGVTFAAPFVDVADKYPFLINRVFALLALAATVLSIAWVVDRARKPVIPVSGPVETAFDLGVGVGKDMGRLEAQLQPWNGPHANGANPMVGEIMNGKGRQPFGWHP